MMIESYGPRTGTSNLTITIDLDGCHHADMAELYCPWIKQFGGDHPDHLVAYGCLDCLAQFWLPNGGECPGLAS